MIVYVQCAPIYHLCVPNLKYLWCISMDGFFFALTLALSRNYIAMPQVNWKGVEIGASNKWYPGTSSKEFWGTDWQDQSMSRLRVRKESSQWKAAGVSKVSWDCNQAGSIGWPKGLFSGIQGIDLKSTACQDLRCQHFSSLNWSRSISCRWSRHEYKSLSIVSYRTGHNKSNISRRSQNHQKSICIPSPAVSSQGSNAQWQSSSARPSLNGQRHKPIQIPGHPPSMAEAVDECRSKVVALESTGVFSHTKWATLQQFYQSPKTPKIGPRWCRIAARSQAKWKLRRICRTIFANKRQIVWMAIHPEAGFFGILCGSVSHMPQSTCQNWLVNKDGINDLCFIQPKEVSRMAPWCSCS